MDARMTEIEALIARGAVLPGHAASIALEIFLLLVDRGEQDKAVGMLVRRFVEALPVWGMSNLLGQQMSYARRLAESEGPLEYEEMHKLFSLCDEIRALRTLGLVADEREVTKLDAALRSRFSAEHRKARLVAEDKVTEWNRNSWWYVDNLKEV